MAMNKSERAELEAAYTAAALRWTAPVERDVPPPRFSGAYGQYTEGWDFNEHSMDVWRGWSSTISHGRGPAPKPGERTMSGRQNAAALYSTKAKALAAMRHAVEQMAAAQLRKIDRQIAEAGEPTP